MAGVGVHRLRKRKPCAKEKVDSALPPAPPLRLLDSLGMRAGSAAPVLDINQAYLGA